METHDFQQQMRALKERVSEMSMRYSPRASTQDAVLDELRELKAQVSGMQERHMRQEGMLSPAQLGFIKTPALSTQSSSYENWNQTEPPSVTLPWQLLESLTTDVPMLRTRVTDLEGTVSQLEDKLDELSPSRFTPASSASGSETHSFAYGGTDVPYANTTRDQSLIPELSSESSFPFTNDPSRSSQLDDGIRELNEYCKSQLPRYQQSGSTVVEGLGSDCYGCNYSCLTPAALNQLHEQNAQSLNSRQTLMSQLDKKPLPGDVIAGLPGPYPSDRPANDQLEERNITAHRVLEGYFQDIEDVLECLCGPGPLRTAFDIATKQETLRNAVAMLAYLADKNLKEAIRKGDKELHYEELGDVRARSSRPLLETFMDDRSSYIWPPMFARFNCAAHSTRDPKCIHCRRGRLRAIVQSNEIQFERCVGGVAKGDRCGSAVTSYGPQVNEWKHNTVDHAQQSLPSFYEDPMNGVAFRDREIARLDEQLRVSQERLRVTEESLTDTRIVIEQLQHDQDELEVRSRDLTVTNFELRGKSISYENLLSAKEAEVDDLQNQVAEKDSALGTWQEGWNRLHESYQREYTSRTDCESLLADERDRNESTLKRLVTGHRKEMEATLKICERKDDIIHKRDQTISRGRKLLDERESEIEMLRRDLQELRDDKEKVMRTADRAARSLAGRDAELANLKRYFGAVDRGRRDLHNREREDSKFNTRGSADFDGTVLVTDRGAPAIQSSSRAAQATGRSSSPPSDAYIVRAASPTRQRVSGGNIRWRRSGSNDRRRTSDERYDRDPQQRIEFRNDLEARSSYNVRSGETEYRGTSPVGTEQPSQGRPASDATCRPPLPAPVRIRRAESAADLRNSSRGNHAIPARKSLSKYQSMHEMRGSLQAYVESDVESGGELGGAV